jgi:biopolymer transport protein ExbB
MTILQITAGGEIDTTTIESGAESLRVIDLLMKGGFVMIPLLILLFITIYIFVERILTLKKASRVPEQFTEKIRRLVSAGDISGARLICSQTNTPIARMIERVSPASARPSKPSRMLLKTWVSSSYTD